MAFVHQNTRDSEHWINMARSRRRSDNDLHYLPHTDNTPASLQTDDHHRTGHFLNEEMCPIRLARQYQDWQFRLHRALSRELHAFCRSMARAQNLHEKRFGFQVDAAALYLFDGA
jgi:hypothetical protein